MYIPACRCSYYLIKVHTFSCQLSSMVVIGETNIVTIFQWERTLHTPIGTQPAQKVAINSPRVLLHVNVRQQRKTHHHHRRPRQQLHVIATPRPPNLPVLPSKQTQKWRNPSHLLPNTNMATRKGPSIHPPAPGPLRFSNRRLVIHVQKNEYLT
jgi:hypothetical protein